MRAALLGALSATAAAAPVFVASSATPAIQNVPSTGLYDIPIPAGLQQNDVIFAVVATGYTAEIAPPAGWTMLTIYGNQFMLWTRRGASAPATGLSSLIEGMTISLWSVAYRGCKTTGDPYEQAGLAQVQSTGGEEFNSGGPLVAPSVTPSGDGRLILNVLQTVISDFSGSFPTSPDGISDDAGWTSRLDATSFISTNSEYHCWMMRERAGVQGVARPGVTLSGGTIYSAAGRRAGTAISLALLPLP